jgi:hypothetical protein
MIEIERGIEHEHESSLRFLPPHRIIGKKPDMPAVGTSITAGAPASSDPLASMLLIHRFFSSAKRPDMKIAVAAPISAKSQTTRRIQDDSLV